MCHFSREDWAKTIQSKLMSVAVLLISRSMFRERTFGKQIIAITLIIFAIHQQFLSFAGVAAGVSPNQHQPLLAFSKFLSDVLKKGMSLLITANFSLKCDSKLM